MTNDDPTGFRPIPLTADERLYLLTACYELRGELRGHFGAGLAMDELVSRIGADLTEDGEPHAPGYLAYTDSDASTTAATLSDLRSAMVDVVLPADAGALDLLRRDEYVVGLLGRLSAALGA